MGCYSLGKMISRALGKHKSRENRRRRSLDKMAAMSPPPAYCHATRSTVKTVTFSNNNPIFIIPSDHPTPPMSPPKHRPEPPISSASTPTTTAATEHKKKKKSGHSATGKAETVHDGTPHSSSQHGPEPAVYSRPGMSYTMTPLPRWEEEDRRRREYFGGEYCYYPTPIRHGIYSFATDANRLTSMFSDENPNACNIV